MVGYHTVSHRQPFGARWLCNESCPGIVLSHPPVHRTLQLDLIPAIDDDPAPAGPEGVIQYRDFHYHVGIDFLHSGLDRVEDMGVCDRLQSSELTLFGENDGRQGTTVDLAAVDNLGPSLDDLFERRSIGAEDLVPDAVGVDGMHTMFIEKLPYLTLARGEPTTEDPSMLLRTHEAGR